MKYKTKPFVIDAIRWTGNNYDELGDWVWERTKKRPGEGSFHSPYVGKEPGTLLIMTLEGTMTANIGDYIICGMLGEFYPCKPEVFEAKYELIFESKEEAKANGV